MRFARSLHCCRSRASSRKGQCYGWIRVLDAPVVAATIGYISAGIVVWSVQGVSEGKCGILGFDLKQPLPTSLGSYGRIN